MLSVCYVTSTCGAKLAIMLLAPSSTALYSFIFHLVLVPTGALPWWNTMVLFTPMTRLADEYTRLGDPVAFQYPDGVVRVGRPPRASRSCLGQKKNHCSPSPLHGSPDIAVRIRICQRRPIEPFLERSYM